MTGLQAVTKDELVAFRTARGWTQDRFAPEIGISARGVGEWERRGSARRPPPYFRLALDRLAQLYPR